MFSSRTFPVLAVLAIVSLACIATPSVSSPVPLSTATCPPTQPGILAQPTFTLPAHHGCTPLPGNGSLYAERM